jgi:hypothetical protein
MTIFTSIVCGEITPSLFGGYQIFRIKRRRRKRKSEKADAISPTHLLVHGQYERKKQTHMVNAPIALYFFCSNSSTAFSWERGRLGKALVKS